ncbi:MAG: hypothetical protein U0X91_31035 [Spirosomataceae bacterium]
MEGLQSFVQVGLFIIAILTLYKGLSEYSKNNAFKRAEILENLIKRFKDPNLSVAKNLLDAFVEIYRVEKRGKYKEITRAHQTVGNGCIKVSKDNPPEVEILYGDWTKESFDHTYKAIYLDIFNDDEQVQVIYFIGLDRLLRHHREGIFANEIYFRNSFDELIDFVLLLIYYLRNEIITMREVEAHFSYYLRLMKDSKAIKQYIKHYADEKEFEWLFDQLAEPEEE